MVAEVYTEAVAAGALEQDRISSTIKQAVTQAHDLSLHAVVLIKPRTIPKTSSGKIQRRACQAQFLSGTLELYEL